MTELSAKEEHRSDLTPRCDPDPVLAVIVADTVVDPIVRFLQDPTPSPAIAAKVAPYNQVQQILLDDAHPLWQSDAQVLIVWTTPQRAIPSFDALLNFASVDVEAILAEVDQHCSLILHAARGVRSVIVVSWSVPPHRRWVQSMALRHSTGVSSVLMQMNLRMSQRLAEAENVILLDSQYWYAALQRPAYDPKLHAMAKVDYSRDFLVQAAREIKAVLRGLRGESRKLIICDLDDTLWGGIVGDDGLENIRLGGHDGVGESFREFQQELLALKSRGIILAVCSKNNPAIALEMIDGHPEMLLRSKDFASLQINWQDKAENIAAILSELRLLPQSAVFLDDQPGERERIRQAFPEMLVPDLPGDVAEYPVFLASLDCFEAPRITLEDQARTELYQQEAARQTAMTHAASMEQWLESLGITLTVRKLDPVTLPRAAQLLNKTNQFNLATRRLEQQEFWGWCMARDRQAWVFSVADRFGDSGITGLVTAEMKDGEAEIVDFVMSCRVMGKQIEAAMLHAVHRQLADQGITRVRAIYRQTAKNQPLFDFIRPKYARGEDGLLDSSCITAPPHIRIVEEIV